MNSALYIGKISHRRFLPKDHQFSYPFFMYWLDLDEITTLPDCTPWFSSQGWAMSRFKRTDYFGDPKLTLSEALRRKMEESTGKKVRGRVCGLMNMRTLGLYFSPVNFYYGFDEHDRASHFLAEVSNIPWNERHIYSYALGSGVNRLEQGKEFHVSPFNPIDQKYSWTIQQPGQDIEVGLEVDDDRGKIFEARLQLARQPLNRSTLGKLITRKPVMTASIVIGIYYQALRLFIKGVPYIPHPEEAT